ncbi:glycine cleavage system protein R [Desulfuromonas sp. TF]|uniref:glycine cleavage system protein R n=1 Tax=Desulfuromonas sp. TF TaxID=1232410 RepID=UPI00041B56EE|nr:ACT domain-containing protein [Desulfuromonas sp. TF]
MDNRYIMTAFGQDRPGIVADVTRLLFDNGCNLQETTMTLLADEFTLILLFTSQNPGIEDLLARECRRLERDKGISAFLRPLQKRRESADREDVVCVLHVEGEDQAGIVYKISQFLADHGVNIFNLQSTVKASPGSGTTIYVMDIHVHLPGSGAAEHFESGLSAVADDLNVDITVSAA